MLGYVEMKSLTARMTSPEEGYGQLGNFNTMNHLSLEVKKASDFLLYCDTVGV